jgi:pilus assembly protein Flp/PilA
MTKALNAIKSFAADEEGTALMEYTILLGILVVAVIAVITTLGGWIAAQWKALCSTIKNSSGSSMTGTC